MKTRTVILTLTLNAVLLAPMLPVTLLATEVSARGFGGGFGGYRGGFDRGAGGFHGYDRGNFGGVNRGYGGFDHGSTIDRGGFGSGNFNHVDHDFGGGFNSFGGVHAGADGGFRDFNNHGTGPVISGRPYGVGHLPTDGGLSGFAGNHPNISNRPINIDNGHLTEQGRNVRNSFNNNNINNVNVNRYGGGYHNYNGYHGYGYHGYGYHGYGYGYHGWGGYPGGWYAPGWSEASAWTFMGVSTLTTFLGLGMMSSAMSHSGSNGAGGSTTGNTTNNITYEGDNVYVNGQPAGSAQQYYQQAQQLAATATAPQQYSPQYTQQYDNQYDNNVDENDPASVQNQAPAADPNEQWQALGVFSLVEPGQTDSNMLLQLAINQKGILRGNYTNQLTNENSQIYGALDKKTQRISWTIGSNNATVFDSSLSDLVKDESQVLVHYGPSNTRTMALIRLPAPADVSKEVQS